MPKTLPQVPMQKLSNERANPKIRASLLSIELEQSKSEEEGSWKHTKMPIPIKIKLANSLVMASEKIFFIRLPKHIDKTEMPKEIANKINLAK